MSVVDKLVSVNIILQVIRVGKLVSVVGKLISIIFVLLGGQIGGCRGQID